jgi:hypothetical protein
MHHTTFQQNPQHSSINDTKLHHQLCTSHCSKGTCYHHPQGFRRSSFKMNTTQSFRTSHCDTASYARRMECCNNLSTKEFTESGNTVWSLELCIPNTSVVITLLRPNSHYGGRTTPLTSRRCILNIHSTNIHTEYFKHGA